MKFPCKKNISNNRVSITVQKTYDRNPGLPQEQPGVLYTGYTSEI